MPKAIEKFENIAGCNCKFDCKCVAKTCCCNDVCECGTNCNCVTSKDSTCAYPENHECNSSDCPEAKIYCCGANCKCEVNCNCVTNKDGFCTCTENSVCKASYSCSDIKTKTCCCSIRCKCSDSCQCVANQNDAYTCPENSACKDFSFGCLFKGAKYDNTRAETCCCGNSYKCSETYNCATGSACNHMNHGIKCYCDGDKEAFTCEGGCKCQLCYSDVLRNVSVTPRAP